MLFDTHAHYDADWFDADRHDVLAGLPARNVGLVVNPGCDIPTSRTAVELAEQYPFLYAAVGYHPESCAPYQESDLDLLRQLAGHPKVVAIGEIGLDYYWEENPPKELQQQVFRAQLALARQLNLPVIVHDRDAHADTLSIIREFPEVKGVFHCYSGSAEMAKELVKMGWMISFTGNVTFKNARRAPEILRWIPLENLMLETDAPYMAPEPFRGQRCDSTMIARSAELIAEWKGITAEEVLSVTLENGKRFFGIS